MRSEKAVSPVIGVMLMLVVTVLLAAAVSAYTGSFQTKKPTPTAVFRVTIVKNRTVLMGSYKTKVSYIQITEVSGDEIPTKDLEIITYNPNAYGKHKTMIVLPNSHNTHYYLNFHYYSPTTGKWYNWSSWENGTSPYLNDVSKGYFGNNPKVDFGNYTIAPGVTITADWYSNYPQDPWNATTGWYGNAKPYGGGNVTGFCACIADGWNVTPGQYITVKIVYLPTNSVIWEKNVVVEG